MAKLLLPPTRKPSGVFRPAGPDKSDPRRLFTFLRPFPDISLQYWTADLWNITLTSAAPPQSNGEAIAHSLLPDTD